MEFYQQPTSMLTMWRKGNFMGGGNCYKLILRTRLGALKVCPNKGHLRRVTVERRLVMYLRLLRDKG